MNAAHISRRTVLLGAAAASAAAIVPTAPISAPALFTGLDLGSAPDLMGFAVGTPGEYDWISVAAKSAEEAWSRWCDHRGYAGCERIFNPEFVTRVAQWDGKHPDTICPADWLRAGLGHCCERCGYETHCESGARIVAGEVVCEECITFADRVAIDPEDAVEELANRIADEGEEDVRDDLIAKGEWPLVEGVWSRAVADAAEDAVA